MSESEPYRVTCVQTFTEENQMSLPQISWIFRLYDVNRDGTVCISDIEQITSAIFYIISEKDDILVKNQISDRVGLITTVLIFLNLGNDYKANYYRDLDFSLGKTRLPWKNGNIFVTMMIILVKL